MSKRQIVTTNGDKISKKLFGNNCFKLAQK